MLKIIIKNKNSHQVHVTNKNKVQIGRSQNCDFIINEKNISRRHLEITQRNGKIYVQDISLNNWILFNKRKLSKTSATEYFDFIRLELPGDTTFSIKNYLEDERASKGDSDKKTGRVIKRKINPKVNDKDYITIDTLFEDRKFTDIAFVGIIVLMVIAFKLIVL